MKKSKSTKTIVAIILALLIGFIIGNITGSTILANSEIFSGSMPRY